MDEFAMGSSGEHSSYGPAKNPWDLSECRAVAPAVRRRRVAARLCPVATGTDTGGSIRQPASFCGVTGIKTHLWARFTLGNDGFCIGF